MVLQAVNEISTNRRQAIDILGVAAMRKWRTFREGVGTSQIDPYLPLTIDSMKGWETARKRSLAEGVGCAKSRSAR